MERPDKTSRPGTCVAGTADDSVKLWIRVAALPSPFDMPQCSNIYGMSCGGTLHFFMHDGLGSVRNVISSTQLVENTYDYTAFGEAAAAISAIPNRYRYTGREWVSEIRVYYSRVRYYDASIGMFEQRDLMKPDSYSYVQNNPIIFNDPLGLWKHLGNNIWQAESHDSGAHLNHLANYVIGKGAEWPCIWPVHKDNPQTYPYIEKGDCYDVSNLTATSGPAEYISMDHDVMSPRWRIYETTFSTLYGWKIFYHLQDVANNGKTPISYIELFGHVYSSKDRRALSYREEVATAINKMGYFADFQVFKPIMYLRLYNNDNNTYEESVKKNGPPRCWSIVNSTGYMIACGSEGLTRDFVSLFPRLTMKATPFGICVFHDQLTPDR